MKLSKLQKVDLREVWQNEAKHFTNWLAEKDNLALLSEEIGIEIELLQTEACVGCFNVDILAEEENSGRKIIIENQLEPTDHDHLGKIITYASGYDAEVIIWIVRTVRDEHKRAIDWLNEHTDDKINFFAIQMEVWKIGDSPFAPKFQIIAKPNDWAKSAKKVSTTSELTNIKMMQLDFWSSFKEYVKDNSGKIKLRKPYPQHWYDISFGYSGACITLTFNSQSKQLGCELYIIDSKPLFHYLLSSKEDIEKDMGCELFWDELPEKKASRVRLVVEGDLFNKEGWGHLFEWCLANVVKFQKVFTKHIKQSGL